MVREGGGGMSILERLGIRTGPADRPGERDTIRKIVDELDRLPPERARHVAAFAYVLSRVARADRAIAADETRTMERLLVEHGGLPDEQAIVVVQMAKTQSLLFGGTDDYSVTKEFGRDATRDQKLALLDCLFAVSAADGSIRVVEENVARQIADEIGLDHSDFVAVRARYRDRRAVHQPVPPDEGP
jgi:uncharacterized tellurite resistance protein B-like protein